MARLSETLLGISSFTFLIHLPRLALKGALVNLALLRHGAGARTRTPVGKMLSAALCNCDCRTAPVKPLLLCACKRSDVYKMSTLYISHYGMWTTKKSRYTPTRRDTNAHWSGLSIRVLRLWSLTILYISTTHVAVATATLVKTRSFRAWPGAPGAP